MTRTLVLPPRLTASAEGIRQAAEARGSIAVQLATFDVPPDLHADYLHGGTDFADAVAHLLNIGPLEAPADWLAELPRTLTLRDVTCCPIEEAWSLRRPAFIKSPNDKSIRAMVYADGTRLPGPDAIDPKTPVLVSDVLVFDAEYRLHLLDGSIHGASQYAEHGKRHLAPLSDEAMGQALRVVEELADTLPSAIVVDIGQTAQGWAVIEANAAWASGIYVTDARRALDVIMRAAGPIQDLQESDVPFVRTPQFAESDSET